MSTQHINVPPENHVKVLGGQGWIGLIDHLGTESTLVNAARVSFGKMKNSMDEKDIVLLDCLIENKHYLMSASRQYRTVLLSICIDYLYVIKCLKNT